MIKGKVKWFNFNKSIPFFKVKWFNFKKGYGFIQPEDGSKDVFVHKTALKSSGIDNLEEGQDITFEIAEENGKNSAVNLKV